MSEVITSTRSRRIAFGTLQAVGFFLYFGFQTVGYPIIGVAALGIAFAGALLLGRRTRRPMFDERDEKIHRRAAGQTVALFGWAAFVTFPLLVVLEGLGWITFPAWLFPVSAFVIVFYVIYAVFQLYERVIAAHV